MTRLPVKLYRQTLIYKAISSERFITLPELVDRVQCDLMKNGYDTGISQRSIQRDLREMNDSWISVPYDKYNKGYYIPSDEAIDPIFENLLEHVTLLSTLRNTENLSDYILPEQREITGLNHLSALIPALKNNRIVEFDYYKFTDTEPSHRVIEPYFLKEFSDRWYLIAKEHGSNHTKTWGLDRIQNLIVTQRSFQRDSQFNPDEQYKNTFGIYTSDDLPVEEVTLSFTPKGGQYLLTRPLHSSQVTLLNTEHEIRIKIEVKLTNDFIMELLSQTDKMTVIAPQHLKERLQNIYKKATDRMTF